MYNKILSCHNLKFQIQENRKLEKLFLGVSGGVLRGQRPLKITPDRDAKIVNVADD